MWMTAADKRVEYAEDIYSVTELPGSRGVELLCPTKHIFSRGDTLNCPTLTIKLEAEFDGVISVETTHWTGEEQRVPNFELYPDGRPHSDAHVSTNGPTTRLVSGGLAASISSDSHVFSIEFEHAVSRKNVTSLLNRSVGFAFSPPLGNPMSAENVQDFKHYIFTQTELAVGESVHGLGERFGPFNKLGQRVEIWNADG
jgi:alpha-D-xyloside xylohydrolase